MARPTVLTSELMTSIVALVQRAVPPVQAAAAFGVQRTTYFEWIARGRGTDERRPMVPIYAEFADAIDRAEAEAESALVGLAIAKARTSADAIAILERRFRDRWKRSDEMTVNIRHLAEQLAAEGMDPQEVIAEAEAILARSSSS